METPSVERWAGVDWADKEHVVRVVDARGEVVAAFRVANSPQGLSDLVRGLLQAGPIAGVAIETSRHVLVHKLLIAGHPVYPINPKVSHQWCKALSSAGATDDPLQAYVLADGLRHHHARLRPLVPDDPRTRQLALLCDAECSGIRRRTALVQDLQAKLKEYFPGALSFFSDWTSPSAWDFVATFSTPEALATASHKKLYGFLKTHRIPASPLWQERIARRQEVTAWPSDPAALAAMPLIVEGLAHQLRALHADLKKLRARIEALFAAHPDAALFASLPPAGPKLSARLLAHFGTQRDRYASARSVQQLAGCVPVTQQSGKSKKVKFRRACRRDFRNTLHWLAQVSLRTTPWARAFYDRARAAGQSHALALRNLAAKWVKIIYRMWVTRTLYNEGVYLASLIRHGSPLVQELQSNPHCG